MCWIIANTNDTELLWSNQFGWVTEDYDSFDEHERNTLALPIDGMWELAPWIKD